MFRVLLFITLMASCFAGFASVPLAPIEMKFTQPSGYTFVAKAHGNINDHWIETIEGHRIAKKVDGIWYYVILDKHFKPHTSDIPVGQLNNKQATGKNTGKKINLPTREHFAKAKQITNPKEKAKTRAKAHHKAYPKKIQQQVMLPGDKPISPFIDTFSNKTKKHDHKARHPLGEQKVLVVLVDYADVSFTYSDDSFRDLIFGDDGVNGFYKNASYNQLSFVPAAETYGTSNDGIVHVTLDSNHFNDKFPQISDVQDILRAADEFFNGADFDTDNDGEVSALELSIVIITAGYEDSYGGGVIEPGVWGHKWDIGNVTLDDKSFGPYTMFGERHGTNSDNEHQATIGIMAHELGHLTFDLPDLYDIDGSSQGIGQWGLMGGGSWNTVSGKFSGAAPADFIAWSKSQIGFATPTVINSSQSVTETALNHLVITTSYGPTNTN